MPTPSAPPPNERAAPGAPARQRWRLEVAQPAATEDDRRAAGAGGSWAGIFARAGLPVAGEGSRPRVTPAAPLPLGIAGEREIVDVFLAERRTVADVRAAVTGVLPAGWRLRDLHDVWVGAPAAPAAVVAADYRVEVAGPPLLAIRAACEALLAAPSLPRERRREKRVTTYDLRPLLVALAVRPALPGGAAPAIVIARLRHLPDAVGRPEEVIAALREPPASPLGAPLEVRAITRERLVLAGDPDAPPPA